MSDKVRIELLNNGGYGGMKNVEFPVEVEATVDHIGTSNEVFGYWVSTDELARVCKSHEDQVVWGLLEYKLFFDHDAGECRPL